MLFVNIILPVFLIVAAGILIEKTSRLDFRTLTQSSLFLFTPALTFTALVRSTVSAELAMRLSLFMLLYIGVLWAGVALLGRGLRLDDERGRALTLTTVMMNVGNFGLPLAWFAFGEAGFQVSVVTFVLFNLPLGSLAILIAQGRGAPFSQALGNMLRIPIFHAFILALLFQLAGLDCPEWLFRPLHLLGQAAIPVMLVLLGMQLARTRWTAPWGFLTLSATIRLVVAPLLAWGLTWLLDIDGLTRAVVILQTSTPSAVLPLLYTVRFGGRPDLVAGAIMYSTLLSGLSLTLLLHLLT